MLDVRLDMREQSTIAFSRCRCGAILRATQDCFDREIHGPGYVTRVDVMRVLADGTLEPDRQVEPPRR